MRVAPTFTATLSPRWSRGKSVMSMLSTWQPSPILAPCSSAMGKGFGKK